MITAGWSIGGGNKVGITDHWLCVFYGLKHNILWCVCINPLIGGAKIIIITPVG